MMVPRAPKRSGGCSRDRADGRHSWFQVGIGINNRPVELTPMPGITARHLELNMPEGGPSWHESQSSHRRSRSWC